MKIVAVYTKRLLGSIGLGVATCAAMDHGNKKFEEFFDGHLENGTDPSKMDIVKEWVKDYGPAIALGGVAGYVCGSAVKFPKTTTVVVKNSGKVAAKTTVATYTMMQARFNKYRKKVAEEVGEEKEADIYDKFVGEEGDTYQTAYKEEYGAPVEGNKLFYNEITDSFFYSTMEDVLRAENEINRTFVLRGDALVNEFCDMLDIDDVPWGNAIGWEQYIGEAIFGYSYIDFNHRTKTLPSGEEYIEISCPYGPHEVHYDDPNNVAHYRDSELCIDYFEF